MIEYDFSKPLSSFEANKLLADSSLRNDFLADYSFFLDDKNLSLYKKFVEDNIKSLNDDLMIDVLQLAENISYFSKDLLERIEEILNTKKGFLIRLYCLDYLLSQIKWIDKPSFIALNKKVIDSKNEFLKLQSNLNYWVVDNDGVSRKNILKLLKNTTYSNLFYRFFNVLKYNQDLFSSLIDSSFLESIGLIIIEKEFSVNNINEMKIILDELKQIY